MVPDGDLGPRGRTLCGEPRQGTSMSETYAEVPPPPPESVCSRCTAAGGRQPNDRQRDVTEKRD